MALEPPESPSQSDTPAPRDALDALGQAEAQELEAQAALAEAQAKAARARAERLRRQAQAGVAAPIESTSDDAPEAKRAPRLPWRGWAVGAAVLLLCGLLGLSGAMAWHHRSAEQNRQREAEYAAVARQGVVNLMSLDFTNAQDDIKRVLDNSIGKFKDDFQSQSEFLVKALEESKVTTEVTVNGVAVQSAADDSAVVLVAATSQATNAKDARQEPQKFRVTVHLAKDDGQLKMSQVDFA